MLVCVCKRPVREASPYRWRGAPAHYYCMRMMELKYSEGRKSALQTHVDERIIDPARRESASAGLKF